MKFIIKNIYFYIFMFATVIASYSIYTFNLKKLNTLNSIGYIEIKNTEVEVVSISEDSKTETKLLNGNRIYYKQKIKTKNEGATLVLSSGESFYLFPETEIEVQKNKKFEYIFFIASGSVFRKNSIEESKFQFYKLKNDKYEIASISKYNSLCSIQNVKKCQIEVVSLKDKKYKLTWMLEDRLNSGANYIEIYAAEVGRPLKLANVTSATTNSIEFRVPNETFYWQAKLTNKEEIHEGKINFYSSIENMNKIALDFPKDQDLISVEKSIKFKWFANNDNEFLLTIFDKDKNKINQVRLFNTKSYDLNWTDSGQFFWSVQAVNSKKKSELNQFEVIDANNIQNQNLITFEPQLTFSQKYSQLNESILGLKWKNLSSMKIPYYSVTFVYENSFTKENKISTDKITINKEELFIKIYSKNAISVKINPLDSNFNPMGEPLVAEFNLSKQTEKLNLNLKLNGLSQSQVAQTNRDSILQLDPLELSPALDYKFDIIKKSQVVFKGKASEEGKIKLSGIEPDIYKLRLFTNVKPHLDVLTLDSQKNEFESMTTSEIKISQKIADIKVLPKVDLNVDLGHSKERLPSGTLIRPKVEDVQIHD